MPFEPLTALGRPRVLITTPTDLAQLENVSSPPQQSEQPFSPLDWLKSLFSTAAMPESAPVKDPAAQQENVYSPPPPDDLRSLTYDPMTGIPIGASSIAEPYKGPPWMIEPDLHGQQTGELPQGMHYDQTDGFNYPTVDATGERVQMIRRPNVWPRVETPEGMQWVMPKLADLASYMGGGSVPLRGGEAALGAGPIVRARRAPTRPPTTEIHDPEALRVIAEHQAANPRAVMGGNYPPEPMAMPRQPVEPPPVEQPGGFAVPTQIAQAGNVPQDPVQAVRQSLNERYGAYGSHPDEEALTVWDILHPLAPKNPPRSRNVEDIAKDLEARGMDALRQLGVAEGKVDPKNPEHAEIVSRAMASEIEAAIRRGGNVATDWYTKAIDEAMEHAAAIWPELKDNPHQKMGFTAALAVTSQGETVTSNARLAEIAYDHFRKTGKFPTNIVADKAKIMNANFAKLNQLIEDHGVEGARNFLRNEYTVKELNDLGYKVGGENMGTRVYGSAILGPKIGTGFYQNLNGNYNPVTMDLWFMRAMGRLTGSLVGRPIEEPMAAFRDALKAGRMSAPLDMEKLADRAEKIMKVHEQDYRANRAAYDAKTKQKSELTLTADRYLQNLRGINETPTSGGHREWMRGLVNRARELLKEGGHNLSNADLQAIWWYPEKELYSKLGGRDSERINTDYATVFRELRARRAAGQP